MDHILPISRGGDSSDENLQVLCSACNTKKGNKIDGEEKNVASTSGQPRVNVEANSIQINDASPSDSGFLIPDSGSLIPDSLIPDCLTRETAPRKRGTPPVAKPIDVDQQTWEDWTALRIKKRATVSQTVIDESRLECAKAGISLDRFLKIWCMRGSQGLQADWLKPKEINASSGETTYQRSMRERVMEFSPSIARQAPGVYPLKNMILEDDNVTTIAGH
jgi:hypothetical protein